MKSKLNSVIALIVLLFSAKAMALQQDKSDVEPYRYEPTPEKFVQDIAELEFRGVIENQDGHFVLKDESALDRLRKDGRVDLVAAMERVVCL